ncbi:sensor histidine kinase [Arsukibacterium indicum]|uniref:histidine kinase n=1 Tax=Arsukibacterium indicum TaxID=2848612 RepID=A0ABS6MPV2_9GAMM|nr:ATP-binding protein [Arsukibacterium indicum]MBV2130801.1 HAMP domain-containing protein [Arsukibacterium indicum]
MYRNRLLISFGLLVMFCIVQAVAAFWSSGIAAYHVERGRVSNQMLAEFIALGADKQRLKVWLAQYLLTNDAPLAERDKLLAQMELSLSNLQALLVNDQQLSDDEQDHHEVNRQVRALSILETNIFALKRSLLEKETITLSEAEIWRLLIQTFDKLEGLDLKSLIAEAIELQRQRAAKAEAAAVNALSKVRTIVMSLAVFGSLTAVLLALLLLKALYLPITRLLEGTSAVATGNFTHRIAELDDREFRNVATSFNTMSAALEEARQAELRHTLEIEQEVSSRTAQLKHALEQLKQAEAQQKQFFADVSHELRTPATAIRGEAEIGLRGKEKSADEYKETLKRILDASAALSGRIDDLLMLIRGENSMTLLDVKMVPLIELATELVGRARREAKVQGRELRLHFDDTIEMSEHRIQADTGKLLQVWQILFDNAVRYSPANSALDMVVCITDNQFEFSITDYGIGIADYELNNVFDRYYRADNARKLRPDGLGIGLSLAKYLIEQHQGRIQVKSNLNQGTTMTVKIRVEAAPS